jgi:hypothetical protein
MRKFGHKMSNQAHTFGNKLNKAVTKATSFVEKKALPFAEKVASGVEKGIKFAEPLVGTLAPELLPELEAAKGLSKMARKGIHTGEKIVDKVQGAQAKAIQAAKGLEGHVAAGANAMMRGDIQSVRGAVAGARAVVKDVNPLQRL